MRYCGLTLRSELVWCHHLSCVLLAGPSTITSMGYLASRAKRSRCPPISRIGRLRKPSADITPYGHTSARDDRWRLAERAVIRELSPLGRRLRCRLTTYDYQPLMRAARDRAPLQLCSSGSAVQVRCRHISDT